MEHTNILDLWQVSREELAEIITAHPSLRGMVLGYLAEYKLRHLWFANHPQITNIVRYDNHDRTRKNDVAFTYRNIPITVEVKSLQTATVQRTEQGYSGAAQCDASDRRAVTLPSGRTVVTTCLLVGEFDLLAINCFEFEHEWRFAFIRNQDLPRSNYRRYATEDAQSLLKTLVRVQWPVQPPFSDEPFQLLDQIVEEQMRA